MENLHAEGGSIPSTAPCSTIESHCKIKMELFKTQDRKVSWKDLLPAVAECGHVQRLPTRDLTGRAVLCLKFDPTLYSNQEQEVGSMRVFFCVLFVSHSRLY
jgi:hypothetical protein